MHKFVIFVFITSIFATGCTTVHKEKTVDIILPPEISQTFSTEQKEEIFFEQDDCFILSYNSNKIIKLQQIKSDATITDLASFFYSLYSAKISPKVQKGISLSPVEFEIAYYSLISQIMAVDALGQVFLTEAMKDMEYPSLEKLIKTSREVNKYHKEDIDIVIITLFHAYGKSNDSLSKQIKKYASVFSNIDGDVKKKDLFFMYKQLDERMDNFQWRQIYDQIPVVNFFTDSAVYEEKALRPYKQMFSLEDFAIKSEGIGKQWDTVYLKGVAHYIKVLKIINNELVQYNAIAKDYKSRKQLEDLRMYMNEDISNTLLAASMIFVDFPFAIFTKYAYIQIQGCKGFMWDDDDKMEAIASLYATSVYGNKMLEEISSSYTAGLYVQLIQLIKSEWSKKRFESFLKRSRLYEIDPQKMKNSDYKSRIQE